MLWCKFTSLVAQRLDTVEISWKIPPDAGLFLCHCHTQYIETLLHCVCLFIFWSSQSSGRYSKIFVGLYWGRFGSVFRSMFLQVGLDGFIWMASPIAGMHDWSWWGKWLINETPLKSVTGRQGCCVGGEGGGEKNGTRKEMRKWLGWLTTLELPNLPGNHS